MHKCPIRGCDRQVVNTRLMCWPHWRLVPQVLKTAVWDAYGRFGVGSLEHGLVIVQAIGAVEERLSAK